MQKIEIERKDAYEMLDILDALKNQVDRKLLDENLTKEAEGQALRVWQRVERLRLRLLKVVKVSEGELL